MDSPTMIALQLAVSFLIGAIPFAVVAMWGTGKDITREGSRNPGFNNVWRVTNFRRSMVSLVGDVSKGGVAVYILSAPGDPEWLRWALGLAAVAGHCWTPFLRFNGGKGVATMAGALLYLEPLITAPCLVLYPTLRKFGRGMGWVQEGAISSMTTMTLIAAVVTAVRGGEPGALAFAGWAMIVLRHIPNIREILGR